MNTKINQKGFTIVELLIVVVVIAILAAISIVAYTGITNRANRSAAMEAANAVKSVATAFQGSQGKYPLSKSEMVNGYAASGGFPSDAIAKLPGDINFVGGGASMTEPSSAQGPKTVSVVRHPGTGVITGFTIYYWDYQTGARTTTPMTVGDTSTASTVTLN